MPLKNIGRTRVGSVQREEGKMGKMRVSAELKSTTQRAEGGKRPGWFKERGLSIRKVGGGTAANRVKEGKRGVLVGKGKKRTKAWRKRL